MCLIVTKPKGKSLPVAEQFNFWFKGHPDGFGLAFLHQKKVRILKGALSVERMFELLAKMKEYLDKTKPEDVDMIFHFRQATNGSISPKNCHPFPITDNQEDLASLDILTDCALAHNGIIFNYDGDSYPYGLEGNTEDSLDKTDTQQFIEDYLVGMGDSLWNPSVQDLIADFTDSRFAFLSERGITYIGDFSEENGYKYSNGGYKGTMINQLTLEHGEATCLLCGTDKSPLYFVDEDLTILCASCLRQLEGVEPNEENEVGRF